MDDILAKRRQAILRIIVVCAILCVGALWWFETQTGLITRLDRYGYPGLLIIFTVGLATAVLTPSYQPHVELGCFFGVALYFVAAIATFSYMQAENNIYTVANTLQWMPIIYVAAFVFFEKRRAIFSGASVFLLSALPPLVVLTVHGVSFWDVSLGALLINGYVVHLMILLTLSLLILLRDQYAQATDLASRMESTAYTDQLTGIANRRSLDDALGRYGEASAQPVALILLDIDHFKRINDKFGHLTGDEVIRSTAQLIRGQLRPTDIVGRWGGEEFLIIAPHTDLRAGLELAEIVRQAVHTSPHPVAGSVSVSAGIAEWAHGRTLRDALHLADRSLYAAKRQGRNRIETFDIQTEHALSSVA